MIPSIETENYKLTFEREELLYCHFEVYNWSVSIYKQMLIDFEEIKVAVVEALWCTINKDDQFRLKLVGMFGFVPRYEGVDNLTMEAI